MLDMKSYMKNYYNTHKDKINTQRRWRYAQNPAKARAYDKKWYRKKGRNWAKNYCEKNKEKIRLYMKVYMRKYSQTHRPDINRRQREFQAKQRNIRNGLALLEELK